jgi:hypothetical protein
MKLKMRHEMRRSQEEIDASFDPINLNYIFQEDPLSQMDRRERKSFIGWSSKCRMVAYNRYR